LTILASLAKLVEKEKIEPSFAGCNQWFLREIWLRAGELNATRLAYEASMTPVHLPASKALQKTGVNGANRTLIR
jgi:hypothetical protein